MRKKIIADYYALASQKQQIWLDTIIPSSVNTASLWRCHCGNIRKASYANVYTSGNCRHCLKSEPQKQTAIIDGYKNCSRCKDPQPIGCFWKTKRNKNGLASRCQDCERDQKSILREVRRQQRQIV